MRDPQRMSGMIMILSSSLLLFSAPPSHAQDVPSDAFSFKVEKDPASRKGADGVRHRGSGIFLPAKLDGFKIRGIYDSSRPLWAPKLARVLPSKNSDDDARRLAQVFGGPLRPGYPEISYESILDGVTIAIRIAPRECWNRPPNLADSFAVRTFSKRTLHLPFTIQRGDQELVGTLHRSISDGIVEGISPDEMTDVIQFHWNGHLIEYTARYNARDASRKQKAIQSFIAKHHWSDPEKMQKLASERAELLTSAPGKVATQFVEAYLRSEGQTLASLLDEKSHSELRASIIARWETLDEASRSLMLPLVYDGVETLDELRDQQERRVAGGWLTLLSREVWLRLRMTPSEAEAISSQSISPTAQLMRFRISFSRDGSRGHFPCEIRLFRTGGKWRVQATDLMEFEMRFGLQRVKGKALRRVSLKETLGRAIIRRGLTAERPLSPTDMECFKPRRISRPNSSTFGTDSPAASQPRNRSWRLSTWTPRN